MAGLCLKWGPPLMMQNSCPANSNPAVMMSPGFPMPPSV